MAVKTLIFVLFTGFICSSSFAFIPDSKFIFDDLVKNLKKSQTYMIKQQTTYYDPKYENGQIEVSEDIFLKLPWKYAKVSYYQDKPFMTVYDGSKFLKIIGNKWVDIKDKGEIPTLFGFYLSVNKDELTSFLSYKGLNMQNSALSRKSDLVTIQFLSPDKIQTKLWLDKDSYVPLGFYKKTIDEITRNAIDVEFNFSSYEKSSSLNYFPMKIDKFIGGVISAQTRVTAVTPDAKLSPNLFDIGYLKAKYKKNTEPLPADLPDFF